MAKLRKKLFKWIASTISIISSIGIGGLFINGTFLNVFLLKFLPLIVHQAVGWIIIGGTIWAVILNALKK